MKACIIVLLLVSFPKLVSAQNLVEYEDKLLTMLDDLRNAENDAEKTQKNKVFKEFLEKTIHLPEAFEYPFDRLTTLGSIKSPDNKIRLFNWNVEQDDMTQKYYCFILRYDDRKREYQVSELVDNSFMIPARPSEILEATEWYGALYYRIIPIEKGSKTAYTLIGWDGNNTMSTVKVLDVLYFAGSSPRLGSPVFKQNNETLKRVFFEYSKKSTMYMNYDDSRDRIVLDHLSPEAPSMKGIYSFYVPDLSYDAYELKNDKWYLKEDVIAISKGSSDRISIETYNNKTGGVKTQEIKNKWIDPSDPDAPGGGAQHVATMPDQEDGAAVPSKQKKKNEKLQKLSRKERKNQPKSYNPTSSGKRR